MKDRILVDTNIWIEFFRGSSSAGEHLTFLLQEHSIFTCGIILFELLQGIRSEKERNLVVETLQGLQYIEMTPSLWEKSATLSALLKQKGIVLPNSDVFVSTIAIEYNLSIFTLDKHFEYIPGISLYKL